jgi:hypothetical protein
MATVSDGQRGDRREDDEEGETQREGHRRRTRGLRLEWSGGGVGEKGQSCQPRI